MNENKLNRIFKNYIEKYNSITLASLLSLLFHFSFLIS